MPGPFAHLIAGLFVGGAVGIYLTRSGLRAQAIREFVRELIPERIRPLPTVPYFISDDPARAPIGPSLIRNGSFEDGKPGQSPPQVFTGSGVVDFWIALVNGGVGVQWLQAGALPFFNAADGVRMVDLTGGAPAGSTKGHLVANIENLKAARAYEVAVELGVGPNLGFGANYGPPIVVDVRVLRPPHTLEKQFIYGTLVPASGIKWQRFAFRFAVPATFVIPPNPVLSIVGTGGNQFIGVDNASIRELT